MSPGRVLVTMLMGLAGGAVAAVIDLVFHLTRDERGAAAAGWEYYVLGAVLGLCIGMGLGATEGLYSGSRTKFWRITGFGIIGGVLCGYVAFGIGGLLYNAMGGDPFYEIHSPLDFFHQLIARSGAWALMGLLLGTAGGVPSLNGTKMRNGAIGGLIGGLVGGFVFEMLASTHAFQGFQLRLLGFAVTGAAIGFFVGLVSEAFKQAWVKVLIGRNEGREHILENAVSVIGRDELADIPVFVDRYLAPRQASIRYQNGRYYLYDEAGRQDTRLRGQVVTAPQPLTDGDVFQLGKASMAFFEKASAAPGPRASVAPPGPVHIPTPGGAVCEFCGVARDPATGACACSVPGAAPGPAPSGYGAPAGGPTYAPPGPDATVAAPAGYDNPFAPYMQEAPAYGGQPAPGYGPRLVGTAGPHAGQVYPLGEGVFTIGREAGRTLTLADTMASRRHAAIYAEPSGYVLRDEGSSNGTFVNGERIQEQVLYPGDEIRIGGSTFRVEE